jgi:prevent-host-death family protein
MAAQFNVHEAKTQLSALLKRVAAGEEIIIARSGQPVARLMPLEQGHSTQRIPGARAGRMWMADDFDEPLAADFLVSEPG